MPKVDFSKYTMERIKEECDKYVCIGCKTCSIFDHSVECYNFFAGAPYSWQFKKSLASDEPPRKPQA